jgi:hypothetical protein
MKALACVLALCGCEWAQRHPAPTAAITGGAIALGTCEIQGTSQATCGIISGSAAALLGVTAAVVMWIVGEPKEDQTVDPTLLVPDEDKPVHVPTKAEPPPGVDEPPNPPANPPATTPPPANPPPVTPPSPPANPPPSPPPSSPPDPPPTP